MLKKMSLKGKIFLIVIICIIILSGTIIIYMGNQAFNLVEENQNLEKYFLANTMQRRKEEQLNKAKSTALSIANNPEIQKAFAERDREKLLEMLQDSYREVEDYYPQWQFHLPDSTSFLRLHMPDSYGDDLSSFRDTVNEANQSQEIVKGLEKGVAGYGFRVVLPIFYEDENTREEIINLWVQGKTTSEVDEILDINRKMLNKVKAIDNTGEEESKVSLSLAV
ncbi:cache domain-containing protein [Fuchsiella alkaliacetigena]|uniref:cache domain-containing protein n=1 Tax=Fuchsiella alkaliacetigena TaxID=957042 RepID=UPI00200B56A4|nr:cache domain-containing protein [Fuchsiella alkaliacetigena]MCK8826113.1 hypothetical protein [Fuchsiella alkaliacetigena]